MIFMVYSWWSRPRPRAVAPGPRLRACALAHWCTRTCARAHVLPHRSAHSHAQYKPSNDARTCKHVHERAHAGAPTSKSSRQAQQPTAPVSTVLAPADMPIFVDTGQRDHVQACQWAHAPAAAMAARSHVRRPRPCRSRRIPRELPSCQAIPAACSGRRWVRVHKGPRAAECTRFMFPTTRHDEAV